MTSYFPASVDIHRGDPRWDWDEDENPYPGTVHLVRSAIVRGVPVQRVAVGQTSEEVTV